MTAVAMSRQDVQAPITKRAWENPEFRSELLADPKAVIERLGALGAAGAAAGTKSNHGW